MMIKKFLRHCFVPMGIALLMPTVQAAAPDALPAGRTLEDFFTSALEFSPELNIAREHLLESLPRTIEVLQAGDAPGYFAPVQCSWSNLLRDYRVLALPAAVFGSNREDYSILSTLSFAA